MMIGIDNKAIGMVSWDPRNMPEYIEAGHNCIRVQYKGKGFGKVQLQEAINRITKNDAKKIIVTTNAEFIPAMRMYERVGFVELQRRRNKGVADFTGDYIDYAIVKQ